MSQQPPGQGWGGAPGQGWGGGPGPAVGREYARRRRGSGPGAGCRGHSRAALGRRGRAGASTAQPDSRPTALAEPGGSRPTAQPAGQPGGPGGQPSAGRPSFATQQFPVAEPKGFLGALFDFSFTSFVTPKVVKVLYILIVVVVGLSALGFALSVLATNVGLGLIVLLIGAPLYFLVVTALYRITLEFFMVIFRMAQDIRAIRERGDFR